MLVAIIVTDCGELITAGAVYKPFDTLPIKGVNDHVTEVFALPVTFAVNCLLWDAERVVLEGLTPTLTTGVSWTVALADFVGSAALVAVIVTDCAALIAEGAVYKPFDSVPRAGFIDQTTEALALPLTVAVNCLLCDAVRATLEGLTPTLTLEKFPGSETVPEPPVAGIEAPKAVDATTPEIWIGIVVVDGLAAIWNVATATVPSAIAVELNPRMMQLFPEHVTLLPALVAADPATTVTPVMSDE